MIDDSVRNATVRRPAHTACRVFKGAWGCCPNERSRLWAQDALLAKYCSGLLCPENPCDLRDDGAHLLLVVIHTQRNPDGAVGIFLRHLNCPNHM